MTSIKRFALLCAALAVVASVGPATPALALTKATVQKRIAAALLKSGASSGALVTDLTAGEPLYAARADLARVPASTEKLYTTATALGRFGPSARLSTELLTSGTIDANGLLSGDLILRGGGDPTFSSEDIDSLGRAVQRAGIEKLSGGVVGDESRFDKRRGGPASGWSADGYIGGSLGGLVLNRGSGDYANPGLAAANALSQELRSLKITRGVAARTGKAPSGAERISLLRSPTVSDLIAMTNIPSDNFLAEMLVKNLGARFGGAGTTPAGAGVIRSFLRRFGLAPQISDGSGLSRANRTSPREVVALLTAMHNDPQHQTFEDSLAVAGRSGTLAGRMNGSAAEGNCRGKTGTLSDVSGLSGLCLTESGHVIVFSILMNGVSPSSARTLQDSAVKAIANYSD
ncbi:MAG: D-alanyl-D-alanine carboxypeptidase/D-alanyl-D-alanine-endopeptidase [Solirubrobacteraceae bacterium]|nr:D-alanyl-D-alanine carboxypeptidase/D-alanyl-D-alanine-endopeptidase [Solirubrobacteraceae bacterium]